MNKLEKIEYILKFEKHHKVEENLVRIMSDEELENIFRFCFEVEGLIFFNKEES